MQSFRKTVSNIRRGAAHMSPIKVDPFVDSALEDMLDEIDRLNTVLKNIVVVVENDVDEVPDLMDVHQAADIMKGDIEYFVNFYQEGIISEDCYPEKLFIDDWYEQLITVLEHRNNFGK